MDDCGQGIHQHLLCAIIFRILRILSLLHLVLASWFSSHLTSIPPEFVALVGGGNWACPFVMGGSAVPGNTRGRTRFMLVVPTGWCVPKVGWMQVHFPRGNQAQVPGKSGEVRSNKSCHLESEWTSKQSMGWTKVCGTAQSGIWVPKGDARICIPPSGGKDDAVYIQDCLCYARALLSVFIQVWTWSCSQTTN